MFINQPLPQNFPSFQKMLKNQRDKITKYLTMSNDDLNLELIVKDLSKCPIDEYFFLITNNDEFKKYTSDEIISDIAYKLNNNIRIPKEKLITRALPYLHDDLDLLHISIELNWLFTTEIQKPNKFLKRTYTVFKFTEDQLEKFEQYKKEYYPTLKEFHNNVSKQRKNFIDYTE